MRYIRFNQQGYPEENAPDRIMREGKLVIGYNRESNESMLITDGYMRYDGDKGNDRLMLSGGVIIQVPESDHPVETRTVYTKLQIRRKLREMGKQDILNGILSSSTQFRDDWNDAQEIDLNDPVFIQALQFYGLTDLQQALVEG